jgi:ubiquinone/menaquinone biosynthesis C-methylase UbiE
LDVSVPPEEAFDALVDELAPAMEKRGLTFKSGNEGSIIDGTERIGIVEEWVRGKRISLLWRPKSWEPDTRNKIVVTFEPAKDGTVVTVESQEWGRVLRDQKLELVGWFVDQVAAGLLSASGPQRLGDWINDRQARSPFGERSRRTYRNPVYHWPNFLVILEILSLKPEDYLLEVGCGGGAFLHEVLKSGCKAAAIDHSTDMIKVAIETNRTEIDQGRLMIEKSEADTLPFPDNTFTSAVMTGVLGFLPEPLTTFKEVCRVLQDGARFLVFTSTKELLGTPAVSEPAASRIHFYEDRELEELATATGFSTSQVKHPSFYEYAKRAGVPESDLDLFKGTGDSQLLVAQK